MEVTLFTVVKSIDAISIMKKLKKFVNINRTTECQWKWNIIRKLEIEMHIFFFLKFPLLHFSPSPILGSILTFMRGYT